MTGVPPHALTEATSSVAVASALKRRPSAAKARARSASASMAASVVLSLGSTRGPRSQKLAKLTLHCSLIPRLISRSSCEACAGDRVQVGAAPTACQAARAPHAAPFSELPCASGVRTARRRLICAPCTFGTAVAWRMCMCQHYLVTLDAAAVIGVSRWTLSLR